MGLKKKLIIAITMGDPAGIGPEITVKALANPEIYNVCNPLVIGSLNVMKEAAEIIGMAEIQMHPVHTVSESIFKPGIIDVYDMDLVDIKKLNRGQLSAMTGEASFQYVKKAIEIAMNKEVDATVTNAICKEAICLAGHPYSGHTEIYAKLTDTGKYTMMLVHDNIRVVHVSTHVSLREACDRVKKERIMEVIKIAGKACIDLGIEKPRIGVAGLNPHSGEQGLFGTEEIEEIIPAIEAARKEGLCVEGPVPPDTVFSKARGGWFDVVVAMYHDQGHIPIKVMGFVYNMEKQEWDAVEGVNITLGLPIIRTSVDHGTAFDQAGRGTANAGSLLNAIDYAIKLGIKKDHRKM